MMRKLLITRYAGRILTALWEDDHPATFNFYKEDGDRLGNIYIARIKQMVKNIHAAFVEILPGVLCYLPLDENVPLYMSDGRIAEQVRPGDEVVVQIAKEAIKTKAPVATAKWNFTGEYAVLTVGKSGLGISTRIDDADWIARAKAEFAPELGEDYGLILRTNAYMTDFSVIKEEIRYLVEQYRNIRQKAKTRTCYSCLYHTPEPYVSEILGLNDDGLEKIMTDDKVLYEELKETLTSMSPARATKLVLYTDTYPMSKLFALETELERATSKQAWLKSGGYLVIEPTEALTVIDVTTGKVDIKKNQQETFFKINMEAAKEAARQMRLRNLTGIVIIDFINLKSEDARKQVYEELVKACRLDPIKTTVVDRTRLELVEVTRKKIRKPLHEQMKEIRQYL